MRNLEAHKAWQARKREANKLTQEIRSARKLVEQGQAKPEDSFVAFLHPSAEKDLRNMIRRAARTREEIVYNILNNALNNAIKSGAIRFRKPKLTP